MAFEFQRLALPGIILVQATRFGDDRGFFMETFKSSAFAAGGITLPFVQDNHSHSARGVLRGLHYQKSPRAQGKLVSVIRGRILDVVVDIRRGSPAYGQWLSCELSAGEGKMLYVPIGFAHGFCVLSDEADVLYKVTAEFDPALDRGIQWNDPDIGVQWPFAEPVLSPKDAQLPPLRLADNNFEFESR